MEIWERVRPRAISKLLASHRQAKCNLNPEFTYEKSG